VGTSREEAAPSTTANMAKNQTAPAEKSNEHVGREKQSLHVRSGTVRKLPPAPRAHQPLPHEHQGLSMPLRVVFALCLLACSDAFTLSSSGRSRLAVVQHRHSTVAMGLFDGLKRAFVNEEFKEDDQRVQCRHILLKGDDDVER
jgi:hypothetical protein